MKALQISKYDAPVDVVTLVEIPQPGRRDSPQTNAPAVIPLTAAVPGAGHRLRAPEVGKNRIRCQNGQFQAAASREGAGLLQGSTPWKRRILEIPTETHSASSTRKCQGIACLDSRHFWHRKRGEADVHCRAMEDRHHGRDARGVSVLGQPDVHEAARALTAPVAAAHSPEPRHPLW